MRGKPTKRVIFVALAVLCVPSLASAQGFGAIGGTVQDPSGAVIPGATVSLSNPGTIGGNQEAVSNERGAYQFSRLVPSGTYSVKAALDGFSTTVRNAVAVTADQVTRLDMQLTVGSVSDTVTVTGETPLLDTTSAYKQTVLDQKTLELLPSGRDVWSIARLVPAMLMSKYDVGGTESLAFSGYTLHGALLAEGNYLVDGAMVAFANSPTTGIYPDPGAFEQINYQAGNAPAEYDRGGTIISMVTRTGSNAFHGRFTTAGGYGPLTANNLSSQQRADLLAAVPARLLAVNPNFVPSTKIKSIDNFGVDASGPIVRDTLWFSASGQLVHVNKYWLTSYTSAGTQILDDSELHGWSAKASWQAGPRTQLHYLYMYSNRTKHHVASGNLFYDQRALGTQFLPAPLHQLRLTSALSSRLALEASVARFFFYVATPAADPSVGPGDIQRFDAVTQTVTGGITTWQKTWSKSVQTNVSLNYVAGSHRVKFGYQLYNEGLTGDVYAWSHYPAGFRAIYRNGVPDSVNTYNTPVHTEQLQLQQGLYVQDTWQASRKLTVNLGLRVQQTHGSIPGACQVQTIFIAGQCFDRIDNVPNWLDLAPRFGLVYDVFGNGKTAVKLAVNRYSMASGVGFSTNVNPIRASSDTRSWADLNGDGIPELNELGPSTGFNLGTTNRYNPDLKRPYTNELNVEVQQDFGGGLVVSAGFFYHGVRRQVGSRNLAVPLESYTPIQVTEKVTGQQVTVYNQAPATRGKFDVLFDNVPEMNTDFNGVDLTFNKRFGNRWMIMGGLSLGRNIGDVYGTTFGSADFNNPNNTYRRGPLGSDIPVSFKVSGLYELPYGIVVSGNASRYTGLPEQDTLTVSRDTVALTQVSQSIAVAPRGTNRLENVNLVDLSARKTFRIGGNRTIEPLMELFNVLNASPVQGRVTVLGPSYHQVSAVLAGRMLKLGFNVKF